MLAIRQMDVKERVSNVFTLIHRSTMELAARYEQERKRTVYVTPVLFTHMFELFHKLLERTNRVNESERSKYE